MKPLLLSALLLYGSALGGLLYTSGLLSASCNQERIVIGHMLLAGCQH